MNMVLLLFNACTVICGLDCFLMSHQVLFVDSLPDVHQVCWIITYAPFVHRGCQLQPPCHSVEPGGALAVGECLQGSTKCGQP